MDEPLVLHLDARLSASGRARQGVRAHLAGRVGDEVVDDVVLVVSELVTNAILHAGSPSVLQVDLRDDAVHLRLSDRDSRPPVRRLATGAPTTTGRGLLLLEALCDRWGVEPEPEGGKTVWCVVRS